MRVEGIEYKASINGEGNGDRVVGVGALIALRAVIKSQMKVYEAFTSHHILLLSLVTTSRATSLKFHCSGLHGTRQGNLME